MTEGALWRLVRFRPGLFALALVSWILYSCYPLATGALTRAVFDTLSGKAPATVGVWWLVTLLAVVEIGSWGLSLGWLFVHLTFEWTVETLLRKNLFEAIMQRPGTRAAPTSSGEAVNRFRDDVEEVYGPINEWYRLAGEGVFAAGAVAVMLRIDAAITLAALVPLAAIVSVVHYMTARLRGYRAASRSATGRVAGFIGEVFGAAQAIKLAAAEPRVVDHLHALGEERRRTALRDTWVAQLIGAFNGNVVTLATGVILLLAVGAMRAGHFTVGDFALFVTYLDWVLQLPRRVGRLLASRTLAGVSAVRLAEMLPDTAPGTLVAHGPVHLDGAFPPLPVAVKTGADRLTSLDAVGLVYHYPGAARDRGYRPTPETGLVHRHHGTHRRGQDDAAACPPWPSAARRR